MAVLFQPSVLIFYSWRWFKLPKEGSYVGETLEGIHSFLKILETRIQSHMCNSKYSNTCVKKVKRDTSIQLKDCIFKSNFRIIETNIPYLFATILIGLNPP